MSCPAIRIEEEIPELEYTMEQPIESMMLTLYRVRTQRLVEAMGRALSPGFLTRRQAE